MAPGEMSRDRNEERGKGHEEDRSNHAAQSSDEPETLRKTGPRDQHASAHCQGRSLFRPLDSPGGTGGPLSSEDTS